MYEAESNKKSEITIIVIIKEPALNTKHTLKKRNDN